jgi:aerobic-type carbon monoxide dehydrogenase small subunit (CoxS/CutS family)
MSVEFILNGDAVLSNSSESTRLLDVLREEFALTGTKEGCGEGECGACAVLIDGQLINSCLVPIGQLSGAYVQSIESIREDSPLVRAFAICGATQCGICTPGMVMAAKALLDKNAIPSLEDIRRALSGNLCRCTGYVRIYEAVLLAAREIAE